MKNSSPALGARKVIGAFLFAASTILIIALNTNESTQLFESPLLLAGLNTTFLALVLLGMTYLATKSYQSTGVFGFLLVGSGLVFFGVSSFYAGWVMPLVGEPKPNVALHNLGSSSEQAIQFAQEKKPDATLMDIRLLGTIDGIEAARRIGLFLPVPIIFTTTGYSDPDLKEHAMALNPIAYLIKPIDARQINTILEPIWGDE